jgi:adenosylhomocysteine nucleosidase
LGKNSLRCYYLGTRFHHFGVSDLIFTGVAGAIAPHLKVGNLVLANALVHHDLNPSPIFARFEIPLQGISRIPTSSDLSAELKLAVGEFLQYEYESSILLEDREAFGLTSPTLFQGLIGTGDEFVSSKRRVIELRGLLPDLLCVEMEGASVAQVCYSSKIPFAVLRTISDTADEHAPIDFQRFIERVASHYSFGAIQRLLRHS